MAHFGISRFEVRPEGTISTTMVGATGLEPLPRVTGRRSPFKIVAGYLTWQGKMVENNGITPKSAIELSREASRSERDTQLEAAVKSRARSSHAAYHALRRLRISRGSLPFPACQLTQRDNDY